MVRSLSELNILDKELKSLNREYKKFAKHFDSIFRRYIGKMGRTRISNQELNNFKKIADDRLRKDTNYPKSVTDQLSYPFLKWMRENFQDIKNEEVVFYSQVKDMKEQILKRRPINMNRKERKESEDSPDSDDEESEEEEEEEEDTDHQQQNEGDEEIEQDDHEEEEEDGDGEDEEAEENVIEQEDVKEDQLPVPPPIEESQIQIPQENSQVAEPVQAASPVPEAPVESIPVEVNKVGEAPEPTEEVKGSPPPS